MNNYSLDTIRNEIIGNDLVFDTPFGKRHLLYVDYTASGRAVKSIEKQIWYFHNLKNQDCEFPYFWSGVGCSKSLQKCI